MSILSNGRMAVTTRALSLMLGATMLGVTMLDATSVQISAQTAQSAPNTSEAQRNPSEAQLKRIRESTQAKLDQLHAAAGFPGATIGFVLPDGRSGSVSTGVSDLATKRPLVPTDLMLAGSIGKTFVAALMLQLASEG